MGYVYGPHDVSYDTARRWRKEFYTGTESVTDAAKSERPVIAMGKNSVSKVG